MLKILGLAVSAVVLGTARAAVAGPASSSANGEPVDGEDVPPPADLLGPLTRLVRPNEIASLATGSAQLIAGPRVQSGAEVLAADGYKLLRGRKVGVVTNHTGVFPDLEHLVDLLAVEKSVNLVAVFGPEHGFRGSVQAGSAEGFFKDPKTGRPVYDTYQKSHAALRQTFVKAGIDMIVFDIQDVGVRYYTYIWTLYDVLVAAAGTTPPMRVVVLDRPNPIGGAVDGPVLQPSHASFVGRKPIALRHGMTIGELAHLFNAEHVAGDAGRPADLQVVKMVNWRRDMLWADTGLPWVPPSPNMPTPTTALLYAGANLVLSFPSIAYLHPVLTDSSVAPGTGLFEGTNCSEGRGTTLPFALLGAPWVDAPKLISSLRQSVASGQLAGVAFREAYFTPTFDKHANKLTAGVHIHIDDPRRFDPLRTSLFILTALKRLHPTQFAWRADNWIDTLSGSTALRLAMDRGASVDELVAQWQEDLTWFKTLRARHLLY